ncbi:MAG TPA: hypothetical protein VGF79_12275 [Bacteroidia bacterium]
MRSSKVYINYSITDADVAYIKQNKINAVVCYDIRSSENLPSQVEVHFSEENRVRGTHEAYRYNDRVINSLLSKIGKIKVNGIDILPAINKLVYWTNYKIGAIKLTLKENFPDSICYDRTSYFPDTYLKSLLKYFKLFLSNNRNVQKASKVELTTINRQYHIGILVNNSFELQLYRYIIDQLDPHELVIFHYGNIDFTGSDIDLNGVELLNLKDFQKETSQPWINPFRLNKEELSVLNILYKDFKMISRELNGYECMKACKVKSLLINEGENQPLRNLLKSVLGEDTIIYNTMNGMKAGEAQDNDVAFDHWFVWNENMRNNMSVTTGLKKDFLINVGHLAEDAIAHHRFENTIQIDTEKLKTKKVITIFSVRGQKQEKKDVFRVIYDLLKSDQTIFVIIKPHPLENPSDYLIEMNGNENIYLVDEKLKNSKQTVYDLLSLSDLTIVFGSTVSLESKLFGVECLSVEYADESLISDVDMDKIKHIRNKEELIELLLKVRKKSEQQSMQIDSSMVSNRIIQVLKSNPS